MNLALIWKHFIWYLVSMTYRINQCHYQFLSSIFCLWFLCLAITLVCYVPVPNFDISLQKLEGFRQTCIKSWCRRHCHLISWKNGKITWIFTLLYVSLQSCLLSIFMYLCSKTIHFVFHLRQEFANFQLLF